MKNILNKKWWGVDTNPSHVDPPPITLVKETSIGKSDGDSVNFFAEILRLVFRTFMSLGYIYLAMINQRGSFYLRETSKWTLQLQ